MKKQYLIKETTKGNLLVGEAPKGKLVVVLQNGTILKGKEIQNIKYAAWLFHKKLKGEDTTKVEGTMEDAIAKAKELLKVK